MSDSTIQIPPDSTGKKLDAEQVTVGANTVQRQRLEITGSAATTIAQVEATNPAAGDHGVVTRDVNGLGILNELDTIIGHLS